MRMPALAALAAALSVTLCPAQDPTDAVTSKQALAQFQAAHGTDWIVQWHAATGTPSAIYGPGLPLAGWQENTLAAARVHAMQLLTEHHDLLGLGSSDFREAIGDRMGRTWSFKFDQYFKNLPVIHGRADIRINMAGVVAMLGSRAWPIPANFDVMPAIAEEVALAAAWAKLDTVPTGVRQPAPVARPRLVIWGDIDAPAQAPVFLAWEVAISNIDRNGAGPIGRYYVDAKNGFVLHYHNDKHECGTPGCTAAAHVASPVASPAAPPIPTTVTLMAWTRTGADAWSALVNTALDGVQISVPGVGVQTTNASGQFTIDIAAPVTINIGALDGRHHQPVAGPNGPTGSFIVNPGVATTIQLSSSAATSWEAAHTAIAYWVDEVNEYCRSILGNTTQLATASTVAATVNIVDVCNAFYSGNTINFFEQGGGCANTAFSTVIAHEWGHGIDDRYGGISNSNAEGVSEGWGDICGMYLVDSPLLGSGFQNPGQALRNGNNSLLWPASGGSPHTAGQVWMGFAWRLRDQLRTAYGTQTAVAISNDIVISSIVADATTRVDAVREVFIADDNDGNLLNGTPNYPQLSAAAIAKAIPYPQIQLVTISHTPLTSTTQVLTPRAVVATVAPISGSVSQVRLHFNAGAGNVVRNMHPNGATNGYTALLPGLAGGNVAYHLEVVHSTSTVVRLPASGEYAYSVNGSLLGFFSANFDSGTAGWTSGTAAGANDWQVGDPFGRSGTSGGVAWADPQTAASGLNCYGNDLGNGNFNGQYPANVDNWLRSPIIDCTGKLGVRLRFKRWLTVEEGVFDQATISVNSQLVWQNPASGHVVDTSWQTVEYALPMADNNPSVQIEWRMNSDAGLHLGGWQIDDVELLETIPVVNECELRLLPEQAAQGAPMTLTVTTATGPRPFIIALGDTAGPTIVPGFPVAFVGGAVALVTGNTDATGNAVSNFPAPAVPSAIGMFVFTHVLTVDGAFTQFVMSNPHVNLFTQTP